MEDPVGIDFGSAFSCVAVYQNDRAEVVANEQGLRSTPSVVAYTTECLVGEPAKNQMAKNPRTTVCAAKRYLGYNFNDDELQKEKGRWPVLVEEGKNGQPQFAVSIGETELRESPERVAGKVLAAMKEVAESLVGKTVKQAVLAVPASFGEAQREALRKAGKEASLKISRMISEPAAAVVAYGLDKESQDRTVMVFDFGASKLEVSVLKISDGIVTILSNVVEDVGGIMMDQKLEQHFTLDFKRKNKMDLTENKRSIYKLRAACERAKRTLTQGPQSSIEIDGLFEGVDYFGNITRARFEDMCGDIFKRCTPTIEKALSEAGAEKGAIDEVIMVGGSSQVPKVQAIVSAFFGGKSLKKSISPEEVIAEGAALQASYLGPKTKLAEYTFETKATPATLGLCATGGVMAPLLPKGTPVPASRTVTFSTSSDDQKAVQLKVYEGEAAAVAENRHLATFSLSGIAPAPKGTPQVEVTFTIDAEGELSVQASEGEAESSLKVTKE